MLPCLSMKACCNTKTFLPTNYRMFVTGHFILFSVLEFLSVLGLCIKPFQYGNKVVQVSYISFLTPSGSYVPGTPSIGHCPPDTCTFPYLSVPTCTYEGILLCGHSYFWLPCMGRTVWGLSPDGHEIFCSHPEWLQGAPNILYCGCQLFPVVKQLMQGTDHPLRLAPRLEKEYCCNSILSLGLHGLLQAESDFSNLL